MIRSRNDDEERTLHGETWDKCKKMKREKRASRSAKSQLCRCEPFTELVVVVGVGGWGDGCYCLLWHETSEDGWCTVRSG